MERIVNWTEFKVFLDLKTSKLHYTESINEYFLWTQIDGVLLNCSIDKEEDLDDATDFLLNTAKFNLPSVSSEGATSVSLTFGETGELPLWSGSKHLCTAGEVSFFDIELTEIYKLVSGKYIVKNWEEADIEDYVEISVVDKNDVLGLFSTYGMVVGTHVLELNKFVKKDYIWEKDGGFESIYGSKLNLSLGLFIRISYNSFGSVNMNIKANMFGFTGGA